MLTRVLGGEKSVLEQIFKSVSRVSVASMPFRDGPFIAERLHYSSW